MVVDRIEDEVIDLLFHALADATRRDILTRTLSEGASVSTLSDSYPMSFAAVQKHVAVLERAGLVTKERRGRQRIVHGSIESVERAQHLLDRFEQLWRARIERMGDLLAPPHLNTPTNPNGAPT